MIVKTLRALVTALLVVGLSACAANSPATPSASARATVRIASLKGPTTMGLVKLMSDAEAGLSRYDYRVTLSGTADEIVPQLTQGTVDIAMIPANLASVLYNRLNGAVVVAAINTLGVLAVVENGDTIHSMADLRGATVYSTGKGTSPEYVFSYLLDNNGLTPGKNVTVEYKSEAIELAVFLAGSNNAIAVLPQPYVTTLQAQNPRVRVALDLSKEWDRVSPDSGLVTGVVVVRRDFAIRNPSILTDFLTDYRTSITFTNGHASEAGQLIAKFGVVPSATLAAKAIPACNITYVDGAAMKAKLSGYLRVLWTANPQSVGGALPGDDFYYSG